MLRSALDPDPEVDTMGWTGYRTETEGEVIALELAQWTYRDTTMLGTGNPIVESRVVESAVTREGDGSVLWVALGQRWLDPQTHVDCKPRRTLVVCTLVERREGCVWTKVMDETMHPYYYSCPPSVLEAAPDADRGDARTAGSDAWRARVRAEHARLGVGARS